MPIITCDICDKEGEGTHHDGSEEDQNPMGECFICDKCAEDSNVAFLQTEFNKIHPTIKEIDEAKVREADLEHRTKIYNEIIDDLVPYIRDSFIIEIKTNRKVEATKATKIIIKAIAEGKISHVSIIY